MHVVILGTPWRVVLVHLTLQARMDYLSWLIEDFSNSGTRLDLTSDSGREPIEGYACAP